jgi:hypothetical protein
LKEFLLPINTQQLCSGDDDDGRIRSCLSQLHQSDITSDERQELDEALHREVGDHLILCLFGLALLCLLVPLNLHLFFCEFSTFSNIN